MECDHLPQTVFDIVLEKVEEESGCTLSQMPKDKFSQKSIQELLSQFILTPFQTIKVAKKPFEPTKISSMCSSIKASSQKSQVARNHMLVFIRINVHY